MSFIITFILIDQTIVPVIIEMLDDKLAFIASLILMYKSLYEFTIYNLEIKEQKVEKQPETKQLIW
jgi:hypothetical protein